MKQFQVYLLLIFQVLLPPSFADHCNADNCMRAILRYSPQAVEFCHDYISIAPVTTTITALPSYISQYPASRVSSACSCLQASPSISTLVTITATSSPTVGSSILSTLTIPYSSAVTISATSANTAISVIKSSLIVSTATSTNTAISVIKNSSIGSTTTSTAVPSVISIATSTIPQSSQSSPLIVRGSSTPISSAIFYGSTIHTLIISSALSSSSSSGSNGNISIPSITSISSTSGFPTFSASFATSISVSISSTSQSLIPPIQTALSISTFIPETLATSTVSKSVSTTPVASLISSTTSTLSTTSSPAITPIQSSTYTAISAYSPFLPSTVLTIATAPVSVTALPSSTYPASSTPATASDVSYNGILYEVNNSPNANYQLPTPTGLLSEVLIQTGNANLPEYTVWYNGQREVIYLVATSSSGITAQWDVTNPSQIAMTNPREYSIVVNETGIYMFLWDPQFYNFGAALSATAPNFFSLLNSDSTTPVSKFRPRSSLGRRDLKDFQVDLTVTNSDCQANGAMVAPYLSVGANNCNVTNSGPSKYLGACSFPPGAVTCQAYLAEYFEILYNNNEFISLSSTALKAAEILNAVELTSLAGSTPLFIPYLGPGLAEYLAWVAVFESFVMEQSGEAQGAATAACNHLPGIVSNLVVSYPGGDPPSQTLLELSVMPTTTVSVSIGFSVASQQPCY
ncbi:hypothetical protein MMC15_008524 [Xylographa vitiligo]|nr:hypothetical protein [Xylographa vitiligo]